MKQNEASFDDFLSDFESATSEFEVAASQFPPDWNALRSVGKNANRLARNMHWSYPTARSEGMQRKDERTLALLRRFSHSAKMVVQHSEGGSEKDIAKMSRYGNNMVARTESIAEMQRTTNEMHAKLDQVDWDEVAENIDWNGIFKDLRK